MEQIEYIDPINQRKYRALQDGDQLMKIGPPEGLVDEMDLPEPFATRLHNALYRRHVYTFAEASKGTVLFGALQEALNVDVQRLSEVFASFEKEVVS